MINYLSKHIIDTEAGVKNTISNYGVNKGKTKIHYINKVKKYYGNFEVIDAKITYNNTLLPSPYLAENLVSKNIASIVKFDIM